jgi:hypothetical protein
MIDALGSEPHFVDHVLPIWRALPDEVRGIFYLRTPRDGVVNQAVGRVPPGGRPILVASIGDFKRVSGRPVALMEHGCGQSFGGGEGRMANSSSYAGGAGRGANLFLHPGPHPAARDRARYPETRIEIVGCAKLDCLPRRDGDGPPVVAVAFHWDCRVGPETRSAWRAFDRAVVRLSKSGLEVIGHGHPRIFRRLAAWYERHGIEPVRSFEEVCRRADVYVNDASSTLFEFASTGRPVVVMNPRIYRRSVAHGLRFWEASTVGVNVEEGEDLTAAVQQALEDPADQQAERERCVDLVYAYRSGAAERAADVLVDWASDRATAAA